jgi:hypothetical protein
MSLFIKNTKSICIIILLLILLSCKSWHHSFVIVEYDPLNPRILTLEQKVSKANDIERRLFAKEVEENLINPCGDMYGYIEMSRVIVKAKPNTFPWLAINLPLLYIPMLLGLPDSRPEYVIEVKFTIMDLHNRPIESYSGVGRGCNFAAAYYGYTFSDAVDKSYSDAINDAFNQIRPKLRNDVEWINRELIRARKS